MNESSPCPDDLGRSQGHTHPSLNSIASHHSVQSSVHVEYVRYAHWVLSEEFNAQSNARRCLLQHTEGFLMAGFLIPHSGPDSVPSWLQGSIQHWLRIGHWREPSGMMLTSPFFTLPYIPMPSPIPPCPPMGPHILPYIHGWHHWFIMTHFPTELTVASAHSLGIMEGTIPELQCPHL